MAKKYSHLSLEERCIIKTLSMQKYSKAAIARAINRSTSTVTREISRNQYQGQYSPEPANSRANRRRKLRRKPYKMDTLFILQYVTEHLRQDWSPKQIAGRMLIVDKIQGSFRVSHQCIYDWILRDRRHGGTWYKHLRWDNLPFKRRRNAKRSAKGRIANPVSIDERPESVLTKRFLGDWEADTVQGRQGRGRLVSFVDRKTRYTVLAKTPSKRAKALNDAVLQRFKLQPYLPVRTVTVDNGLEFAGHVELAAELKTHIYFAHPYCSYERGLNENTNGLIRQYFPKGTDFLKVSKEQIAEVERRLNNRPREVLGYRTPAEVMKKLLHRRGVALVI